MLSPKQCIFENGILLMQIPRSYTGINVVGGQECTCYAGRHKYRAVPYLLSLKLDTMATTGYLKNKYRSMVDYIATKWSRLKSRINIVEHYRKYQDRKRLNNFLRGTGI